MRRMNIKTQKWSRDERGFSVIQMLIAFAVMMVLSGFAIIGLTRAKQNLKLQNSVRQLSSYLEKARLDAIKRHGNSSVVFTDISNYVVTMDWGAGVEPRTFQFEPGITIDSATLPNVNFNWRGRTQSCTTRFTVQNVPGEQNWIAVSDAGDVTVNSDVDSLPGDTTFVNVDSTADVSSTAVVSGSNVHNNAADCTDDASTAPAGPPIIGSGPGCSNESASPGSFPLRKNGAETKQVTVTPSSTGTVTVQAPINLQVTPQSVAVTAGTPTVFSITSRNGAKSTFAVNFNTPCTTLTVLVTVTN